MSPVYFDITSDSREIPRDGLRFAPRIPPGSIVVIKGSAPEWKVAIAINFVSSCAPRQFLFTTPDSGTFALKLTARTSK